MKKRKILFVTNHFGYSNGVAMALRNIISNIDASKYDISVLAIYTFDNDFAKPIAHKIHVVPGFGFYFRGLDKIINLIPPSLLYKKFVKQIYDLEISFQYGIPTKCISTSNKPKICWMHTYDKGLTLRKYYECYDKVVTVARIGSEKLVADGFDKNKATYCYNIIDESVIDSKRKEKCPLKKNGKTIIITVARLDPDKAHMRFFRCINSVKEQLSNLQFWIVGGGSEEQKLKQYISENGLNELIVMTGAQNNPFPYMEMADVYYCCSYREGFSTTCQEAAIMGIPVVSVDVDGAEELVELAECGKVVLGDEEHITKSLIDLSNKDDIAAWKQIANSNKYRFYKAERIKAIEGTIDSVEYQE